MADDPDSIAKNYEYQVPIFVLTHKLPERLPLENDRLTFTFVTDGIKSAIQKAKAASGNKEVIVIGSASVTQQCLHADLADELHVDIMPVLFGGGLRPFENIDADRIQLERTQMMELPGGRTHIRFRISNKHV